MTRIENLKAIMDEMALDALYINHVPNIRYLSNFSGSSAIIILTKKTDYFITDFRYKDQSAREVSGFEIRVSYDNTSEVKKILESEKVRSLGFESTRLSYVAYEGFMTKYPGIKLVPLKEKVEQLTVQKTGEEISKIKKAVDITDRCFSYLLGFIKPGMTELEVSAEITYSQKKLGALKDAFDPIVASGKRGALPHGIATDKKIEKGEMVTLDFGCICEGFCSDMTRTIAVGRPDDEMKKIYQIVYDCQMRSIESARAGIKSTYLDSVARDFIKSKGYGDKFGHGLGHGLGIEVHELPRLMWQHEQDLMENMVVTIEPGIYIENSGGVRIEDDVLLKAAGCEVLNTSEKKLIIL